MTHTPTPWLVIPTLDGFEVRHRSCVEYYLKGTATERAAELNAAEQHAGRCVNSHDALLAACEAALNHADKQSDGVCDCHVCEQLRAAIKLARGA